MANVAGRDLGHGSRPRPVRRARARRDSRPVLRSRSGGRSGRGARSVRAPERRVVSWFVDGRSRSGDALGRPRRRVLRGPAGTAASTPRSRDRPGDGVLGVSGGVVVRRTGTRRTADRRRRRRIADRRVHRTTTARTPAKPQRSPPNATSGYCATSPSSSGSTCATRQTSRRCSAEWASRCPIPGRGVWRSCATSTRSSPTCSSGARPSASRPRSATRGSTRTSVPTDACGASGRRRTAPPGA